MLGFVVGLQGFVDRRDGDHPTRSVAATLVGGAGIVRVAMNLAAQAVQVTMGAAAADDASPDLVAALGTSLSCWSRRATSP